MNGRREPPIGLNGGGWREEDQNWVVLLEASDDEGGTIDAATVERLMLAVADARPTTLYSPDRYALQVCVAATDPVAALTSAYCLWKEAVRRTDAPPWRVIRTEVLTLQEFEYELQSWDAASDFEPHLSLS